MNTPFLEILQITSSQWPSGKYVRFVRIVGLEFGFYHDLENWINKLPARCNVCGSVLGIT